MMDVYLDLSKFSWSEENWCYAAVKQVFGMGFLSHEDRWHMIGPSCSWLFIENI